ncbi:MAG: hypothetical protein HYT79_08725 [Elusimicrobia bacterium]|nr:hypothetical protein [Elusimicrobiota bacterium]
MNKAVQYFSDEYLEQCRKLTPEQILEFLEDFRALNAPGAKSKSRLISMKVPENLLSAFKTKSALAGIPYQAQIKRLMRRWALGEP